MQKSNPYKVEKYYTVEAYLKKRMQNVGRQLGFKAKTLEEYRQWKQEVRSKLTETIGLNKMLPTGLNPIFIEKVEKDGYIREKVVIETEPDIFMPFYVLIPQGLKAGEKRPSIIAPHGHLSAGKVSTAGISELDGISEGIKRSNNNYGVQMVKEGFIVFCPDARGFGERREKELQGDDSELYIDRACTACSGINRMAIALGQSIIGMWVWDLMRLIDYIQTREECAPDRIGCAGLSGGGMQTLWLTALDDRIKACTVSGYFYGFEESLLEMLNCSCNYSPHIFEYIDAGDLGALIAPRDMIIETGNRDPLNGKSGLENVISQVEITKAAYKLYGEEKRLVHDIFDAEHIWHGVVSIPRMKEVL